MAKIEETENPAYPISDWKLEVENNYTSLGYADWAQHCEERDGADEKQSN